jgi:hypothetical protein
MSSLPILGFWGTKCLIPSRSIQFQLVGDIIASFSSFPACTMSTHLTSNCSNASMWKAWHLLCSKENTNKYSLRSEMVDHTLCNSDQNVGHDFFFLIIESATPHLNLMEWPCLCQLCWMHHLAHPIGLTWSLTQHRGQGLHHSIVHEKFGNNVDLILCKQVA